MKGQDKKPIMDTFNYTEEYVESLNFHHFYHQTDNVAALDYEGYQDHERFYSDEQWELTHEFQKVLYT